ncbi:MAG: DUF87 domain-containing protein [Candidatus Levybacteria bacterium]|nr:DUF87 domain-containing protein [Candidatus Levybacteria bacterium]
MTDVAPDAQNALSKRVILEIKTSRTGEETPEAMKQFLTNLTNLRFRRMLLHKKGIPISLEIAVVDQAIHFYVTAPIEFQSFLESQLVSQYPKASILKVEDYLPSLLAQSGTLSLGQLKLEHDYYYPIRTYADFKDVDPLSSVIAALSKNQPGDSVSIQFLLYPVSDSWQRSGKSFATSKTTDGSGAAVANPYAKIVEEKVAYAGFKVGIRLAVGAQSKARSSQYLLEIANTFSSFNNPSGNSFRLRKPYLWQKNRIKKVMLSRSRFFTPTHQYMNVVELATLFHLPTNKLATIPNISWHQVILSDAPENLPVAEGMTEEQKLDTNFFARTQFRNKPTVFGIKTKDRRRHFYVIGKTGTGKSTLIANMAINDMRQRRGFCIIDPHGDLCETVMDYVPSYRVNDVIYLDPSEKEYAFSLNPFEVKDEAQKELTISGIVAIFQKIFADSWGPRLEYILRNTLQSVIEMPDATLLMVPEALSNPAFRKRMIANLTDPILRSFWENEFEKMTDKLRIEAISPIQNKVGQFISSTVIRNIIKSPKSTIDLQQVMDEGKIVLMNLSQGKLGEDNAALLGAMFITKFQLSAMNRVYLAEEERKDFYLYVDEFQNFATSSFIKILSEARKYRLNLLLANQYIGQIPEDVRLAIFGNCGTMMSFLVGAGDSPYLAKEFSERFKEEDILALANYQSMTKMMIDGRTSPPFMCYTLPLPNSETQNREKVIQASKERYMKPVVKEVAVDTLASVAARAQIAQEDAAKSFSQPVQPIRSDVRPSSGQQVSSASLQPQQSYAQKPPSLPAQRDAVTSEPQGQPVTRPHIPEGKPLEVKKDMPQHQSIAKPAHVPAAVQKVEGQEEKRSMGNQPHASQRPKRRDNRRPQQSSHQRQQSQGHSQPHAEHRPPAHQEPKPTPVSDKPKVTNLYTSE